MKINFHVISIILLTSFITACASAEPAASDAAVQTAIAATETTQDLLNASVEETLAASVTEEPAMPAYDYSAWTAYSAPEGYSFYYPVQFESDAKDTDTPGEYFVVLFPPDSPQEIYFTVRLIDDIVAERDAVVESLDDVVFTELDMYGMVGFVAEGVIPGDGFGGGSTVYEAFFELGDLTLQLDCPWDACDRDEFGLILQSFELSN